MSRTIRDFAVYGIMVAGLLVLVRPGSQGATFVTHLGGAAIGFVQAITGQKVTKG